MKVNIKGITKKRNEIQSIYIPDDSSIVTVKDLIVYMVTFCVKEYNVRKENGELLKILSNEEIDNKAKSGKVGFGVNYGGKEAKIDIAIEHALQSFEDGVTVLFIDDKKMKVLDEVISITEDTVFTFVKLTMLSGRMW